MTADFSRAERADNWMGRVCDWIYHRAARSGLDAWNYAPEMRQTRERSCNLLVRADSRREREVRALAAAGVPEQSARSRLRDNAKARDRARARS
jgi:hypothetical protein